MQFDLQAELEQNDRLPDPLSSEQRAGMMADLIRAQREHVGDGEAFLAACLDIVARWGARGGRKYASERIQEVRAENTALWQVVKDLARRVDWLERERQDCSALH